MRPASLPTPAELREAFLWAERRQVTKTATVQLHGNRYQVDPALAGHQVELVFDPFDLTKIDVRYAGRDMGTAAPSTSAATFTPGPRRCHPRHPTGQAQRLDYLALVEARVAAATRRRIAYAELADADPAADHHAKEAR